MVGWRHQLNGLEFEQTPGDVKGREAECAAVLWFTKSWRRLSNRTTRSPILFRHCEKCTLRSNAAFLRAIDLTLILMDINLTR